MFDWNEVIRWFVMGICGGLGFNVISTLYRLIVKG